MGDTRQDGAEVAVCPQASQSWGGRSGILLPWEGSTSRAVSCRDREGREKQLLG